MRRSTLAYVFFIIFVTFFPLTAWSDQNGMTLLPGGDYAGADYRTIKDTSFEVCSKSCAADGKCQAFTFNTSANRCFIKSEAGTLMPYAQAVAGAKAAPRQTASTTRAPDLNFLEQYVVKSSDLFAKKLKSAGVPPNKNLADIRADLQTKTAALDFVAASELSKNIISFGDDTYEAWRNLALAANAAQPLDAGQPDAIDEATLPAAVEAYYHSVTPQQRGESLSLLGNALARTGSNHAAIAAYRAAATADPTPALIAVREDAITKYGFRVLDFKVGADEANPRVCVKFSEQLKSGRIDFMPFVAVDGAAPAAVQANGSELCVDGLKRGIRTGLTIRDGLPSEQGDKTLKPVELSVYIRDRAPTVHFNGQKYVLPGAGRHGVPITSINSKEIAIEIYHIPERGLAGFVKGSQFLSQITSDDANKIAQESGQKIWSGTLAIEMKNNEEVTTSFPLDDALKNRLPGVYVMVAKATEAIKNEDGSEKPTQWLIVSDIGLTTLSNQNGLTVFARSLNTAKPLSGANVSLIAQNNTVLSAAKTDANGIATFADSLVSGTGGNAPAVVTADGPNNDFGFIDLERAAFDFSDRGVGGRLAPGPIDVMMYTDRGIYRPGHVVHLTALARDNKAVAIEGLPLTFIVTRPDGVEYQRFAVKDAGLGSYNINVELRSTAMRGMWTAAAYTDPKKATLGSMRFRVDDFVPDRFEFKLESDAKEIALDQPTEATVSARFLYGAPASGLKVEGDLTLTPTRYLKEFPDYNFGLQENTSKAGHTKFDNFGLTDDAGKATLDIQPTDIPQTTQPLEGKLNVSVIDDGGRAIEQSISLPAAISQAMIGIKPSQTDVEQGADAQFDVIAIDKSKSRIASGPLKWEILRVRQDFQWYQKNGRWSYETTEFVNSFANGKVEAGKAISAQIKSHVEWGQYRLLVESVDPNGPAASYDFHAGWYVAQTKADSPDVLQIALDKPQYKVGDTAVVKLIPRFAGSAQIVIVGEKIIEMKTVEAPASGVDVSFTVTQDWAPGTYVAATVFRPATTESKMPGRAIGVMPIKKDEADRTLSIALDPPKQMRPRTKLSVPVKLDHLTAGETGFVTLAAVDVGVLNVTHFTPPDAAGWFYSQRKLAVELRDIYGQLIDGSLGNTGAIRSGGDGEADAAGGGKQAKPSITEVVSLYSGIVATDADGRAVISFDVPEFNGSLRLMAVAWSKNSLGSTSMDIIVRDPVVIAEGLPRVLAPGDNSRLQLALENTDGPDGSYSVSVKPSSGLNITTDIKPIDLVKGQRKSINLPMLVTGAGLQTIDVALAHGSGLVVKRHLSVFVRPPQLPNSMRRIVTLTPGQSVSLSPEMLAGQQAGTGSVSVSITRSGALDIPGILQSLDRYPYGCTEQTTSRALPLIYLNEVASQAGLEGDKAVKDRVQDAIFKALANQTSEGSFGLWNSSSSDDLWLDSYVTDFLTRAKEKGFNVPQKPFENALNNLQNAVATTTNVDKKSAQIAYAFYVLARNKKASIGDLRFYAETKMDSFTSPMAKAQLAAALALYGDKQRATAALDAAVRALKARKDEDWYRIDYGSNLRDSAAVLAYALEADAASPQISGLVATVARFQAAARWTSTQEESWMLLAAKGLLNASDAPTITVAGKGFHGDYVKKFTGSELSSSPKITNDSDHTVDAVITTTGVPAVPPPMGGTGFKIERNYFTFAGKPLDLKGVKQNDRAVVTLKVKQDNIWPSKIMITDLLPSGFEIDNPALVSSAGLANFEWLKESTADAHLEFRDDRFAAAVTRGKDENEELNFAYVVRAVTPGKFTLPPAVVEDMYRPYLNANTATGEMEVK